MGSHVRLAWRSGILASVLRLESWWVKSGSSQSQSETVVELMIAAQVRAAAEEVVGHGQSLAILNVSQPYAFRGGSGAGNASAPAPGHRRGAAACRKARRGEGAAASARSKCSRSLHRLPRRSPGASGRLISCPRSLRIADLPATLARREGERHGRVEDAGGQGRVGSRWSQGRRSST